MTNFSVSYAKTKHLIVTSVGKGTWMLC